jgi:glucose-6-phosphate isomerase
MLPLAILGVDTVSFAEGAADALLKEHRDDVLTASVHIAILAEGGVHTVNFFTFNERLRLLGFWYRQLLAESIGKSMTTEGATFSHQLLPTVATSVDLHSMAQLYLGGYKGMYTHFVYGDVEHAHHKLSDHWLMRHLPMLKDRTPLEVKNAIREGVFKAYDDQKLPYRLSHLPKITAYELGLFMSREMFSVMCLGALFHVDVFNQPNVEAYKSYMRKILLK